MDALARLIAAFGSGSGTARATAVTVDDGCGQPRASQIGAMSAPLAGRRPARPLIGVASLLTALLLVAVASPAAEAQSFPGQGLLHNRAWEMVSPPDKNGGNVAAVSHRTRAGADGNAVQFSSATAFADAPGTGLGVDYISRRGSERWVTHAITPPQDSLSAIAATANTDAYYRGEFSPDLSKGTFASWSPLPGTPAGSLAVPHNLYLREDLLTPGFGSYRFISPCPLCEATGTPLPAQFNEVATVGASDAFDYVAFESRHRLTADVSSNAYNLFEWNRAGRDETQMLTVSATAGTFQLGFDGSTTAELDHDATAAEVQAALNGLASVGGLPTPGEVAVSGGPGDETGSAPYFVTFGGSLARLDVEELSVADGTTPLSGGAGASVATTVNGGDLQLAGRVPASGASCDDRTGPACVPGDGSIGGLGAVAGTEPTSAVAADGSRVIFSSPTTSGGTPEDPNIYARIEGRRTVKVNASERTVPEAEREARFQGASDDARRVVFTTEEALVDEDSDGNADVYIWDSAKPAGSRLTLVSVDEEPADLDNAEAVLGVSDDGRYIYFVTSGQLVAGEQTFPSQVEKPIYVWHDGEIDYIGYFNHPGEPSFNVPGFGAGAGESFARVTPSGEHLVFAALDGVGLTGYDHGSGCHFGQGCIVLYHYDAVAERLECVSCRPSGAQATSDVVLNVTLFSGAMNWGESYNRAISDSGRYVFFSSGERLVAEDVNSPCEDPEGPVMPDCMDAYVYDTVTRQASLLSSGRSGQASYFLDASPDGGDAFFVTREPLSGWDKDESYDLYDARIGGGLPEPEPQAPGCFDADSCRSTSPPPPSPPTPSASLVSEGDVREGKRPRCAVAKRALAKARRKLRRSSAAKTRKAVGKARKRVRRCQKGRR